MTNERKIELLKILKTEFETGKHSGLCLAVIDLYFGDLINFDEYDWLDELIHLNQPEGSSDGHYWDPFSQPERFEWINARIKELSK